MDVALEVVVHSVKEHTLVLELVGSEVLEVVIELVFMTKLHSFQLNAAWLCGGIFGVRSHLIGVLLNHQLGTRDGSVGVLRRTAAAPRSTRWAGRLLKIVVLALILIWVALWPTTTAPLSGAGSFRSSGTVSGSPTAGARASATTAASNAAAVDIDRWSRGVDLTCAYKVPPEDVRSWFS